MKLTKYIVFSGMIVGALALSSFVGEEPSPEAPAPVKKDTYQYYLKGVIKDKATGVTVQGAQIKVEYKHKPLGHTSSNEDGDYELKWESTQEFTGAELEFIIQRDGYMDKRVSNVPLRPGEPIIVNFAIVRKVKTFKPDRDARRWETIEYLKELNRY